MDGDHDEQGEFEDWDDAVEEEVRPLFSPRVIFDSVEAALEHDAQTHGFDLRAHAQRLKLDFYGATRLVNFIRSEVAKIHATRGAAGRLHILRGTFTAFLHTTRRAAGRLLRAVAAGRWWS